MSTKKADMWRMKLKATDPLRQATNHHPSNGVALEWTNLQDAEEFREQLHRMQFNITPDKEPIFVEALEKVTLLLLKANIIK